MKKYFISNIEMTSVEFAGEKLSRAIIKLDGVSTDDGDNYCELRVVGKYIATRAAALNDCNSEDPLSVIGCGLLIYAAIPESAEINLPLDTAENNVAALEPVIDAAIISLNI